METRIQLRRDTDANWSSNNPVLAVGEIGFNTDNFDFKIGNGINNWNNLSYFSALISSAITTQTIATEAESESGEINDKLMTPLRTSQAIAFQTNIIDGGEFN